MPAKQRAARQALPINADPTWQVDHLAVPEATKQPIIADDQIQNVREACAALAKVAKNPKRGRLGALRHHQPERVTRESRVELCQEFFEHGDRQCGLRADRRVLPPQPEQPLLDIKTIGLCGAGEMLEVGGRHPIIVIIHGNSPNDIAEYVTPSVTQDALALLGPYCGAMGYR